ncbi:MAG: septum formation protein Maf [Gemmatimonadetes bacterium]|nr:septum formation protein Maf [Gemmatimonadota bacterium]
MRRLVLASASPRRADILRMLGLDFDVRVTDVPERREPGERPDAYVERLAREKATAASEPDARVLAGDTVVVLDDTVLEKPVDAADAEAMLLALSGREHVVLTGMALSDPGSGLHSLVAQAHVRFRTFDATLARRYVQTGEPMDKAGAYGIQSRGAALIERIDGDFFTVMGLSVAGLMALLERAGVPYRFGPLG